jgi:hypothetical protein
MSKPHGYGKFAFKHYIYGDGLRDGLALQWYTYNRWQLLEPVEMS